MDYKNTLETLRDQREEILTTLDSFGLTELKILAELESKSIMITYKYLLKKDQGTEEGAREDEEGPDTRADDYLQRKLNLTSQDFEDLIFTLVGESDEILTDREKEDLVEYTVENLQELINQVGHTEIFLTGAAEEVSSLSSEEVGAIEGSIESSESEEESIKNSESEKEKRDRKRGKEPKVPSSPESKASSSPTQSPATKMTRTLELNDSLSATASRLAAEDLEGALER